MDNDEVLASLDQLIHTCRDGDEDFRACAEQAGDTRLKAFFSNRAQTCASAAVELEDMLRARGGDPIAAGDSPQRHRLDLKPAADGRGKDKALLDECERSEDAALAHYRRVLEKSLPADIRSTVERQYQGALKNHDEVKSLRDQYRGG